MKIVRKRMIDCVLSTDMSNHFITLSSFTDILNKFYIREGNNLDKLLFTNNSNETFKNQQSILSFIIHASDISNPCKQANVCRVWVDLLFTELFSQGMKEEAEGLPFSYFCDRKKTKIIKVQLDFIKKIVRPTFESLMFVTPEIEAYYINILENENRYEQQMKPTKA